MRVYQIGSAVIHEDGRQYQTGNAYTSRSILAKVVAAYRRMVNR